MEGYRPGDECAKCGGRCCKEHGCSLAPSDLLRALGVSSGDSCKTFGTDVSRDALLNLLQGEDGLYAIDRVSGPKGAFFFMRMRHKCYTFVGVDAMGECIALTETGCRLSFEERPQGGRCLKSAPDYHCRQEYDIERMLADWEPYQELLQAIYTEYERIFTEDGTFDRCDEAYFARLRAMHTRKKQ